MYENLDLVGLANKKAENFFCKIPDSIYFASPALGHSALCKYKDSPAHYKAYIDNPPKDMPQFIVGRAIHAAVLEPEVFETLYKVAPALNKNTKKYKEWVAELEDGEQAIDLALFKKSQAIKAKLMFDNELSDYLTAGHPEVAAFCVDPNSGIHIKAKFDYYIPDRDLIVDLKTTSKKINSKAFEYGFIDYNYIVQAAYYTHIAEVITGRTHTFAFLSVEIDPPHEAIVSIPDVDTFELGQKKWMKYIESHKSCLSTNFWPGYDNKVRSYRAPEWQFNME